MSGIRSSAPMWGERIEERQRAASCWKQACGVAAYDSCFVRAARGVRCVLGRGAETPLGTPAACRQCEGRGSWQVRDLLLLESHRDTGQRRSPTAADGGFEGDKALQASFLLRREAATGGRARRRRTKTVQPAAGPRRQSSSSSSDTRGPGASKLASLRRPSCISKSATAGVEAACRTVPGSEPGDVVL
jgi:hypothetical protein